MEFRLADVVAVLTLFSKASASGQRVMRWLKGLFGGQSLVHIQDVIALPIAVTAYKGKCYIRLYLLGARRRFGMGMIEAKPRLEAVFFPNLSAGLQYRTTELDGVEDRFPIIRNVDPHYRVILTLRGAEGAEICQRVLTSPHSMAALIFGEIGIESKRRKYDVPVVPLSLSLGNGVLEEHQGPLLQ